MVEKIVFFGSIGIAREVLEYLVNMDNIKIVGVCCEKVINDWRNEESVYSFAVRKGLRVLEISDVRNVCADLGISVRFNKIIKNDVIRSFKYGIVNTHGGILPEYRGSYCNINAILNGEREYGVTLHYISTGIDDGDIIDIKKMKVDKDFTGFDLYKKSEKMCYEILRDNMEDLIKGTNIRVAQEDYIKAGHVCNSYKREKTMELKNLTVIDIEDPLWIRTVKAFDSPYHEPAYFLVRGEKFYVRYRYCDRDTSSKHYEI